MMTGDDGGSLGAAIIVFRFIDKRKCGPLREAPIGRRCIRADFPHSALLPRVASAETVEFPRTQGIIA